MLRLGTAKEARGTLRVAKGNQNLGQAQQGIGYTKAIPLPQWWDRLS